MSTNNQPITVIARLLDLTERRVQQLARDGVIPRSERGRYDLIGAVRGYVRYLRDQTLKDGAATADYGVERARLVRARADLAEMEAAQKRGELIPAREVVTAWTEVVALLRARLLVLPDKIAPLAHDAQTIPQARDIVRKAVHEALAELAATQVSAALESHGPPGPGGDRPGGARGGDAATGADHQPVGGPAPQA